MSKSRLFILTFAVFSTGYGYAATGEHNFDWLLGNWERTNEQKGKVTREIWKKSSSTEYVGVSFTRQGEQIVWQENLKLVGNQGDWRLLVIGEGEAHPTEFRLTHIGKQDLTSENPQNTFPTQIRYARVEDRLEAKVSGANTELTFAFTKVNAF